MYVYVCFQHICSCTTIQYFIDIFGALGAYEKRVWHIIEPFNFEGTLIVPHTFEALNGKEAWCESLECFKEVLKSQFGIVFSSICALNPKVIHELLRFLEN